MSEREKDKKDRSKRSERSTRTSVDREANRSFTSSSRRSRSRDPKGKKQDSERPSGKRSSSSRNLMQKTPKDEEKERKMAASENVGSTRTLERQTSNNADSMQMLLNLAGKKKVRRSDSDSSSSSSDTSRGKGPPLTGDKPKTKNVKLNPKLVPVGNGTTGNASEKSSRKGGSGRDEQALDLSGVSDKKRTQGDADSSQYTEDSSIQTGKRNVLEEPDNLSMSGLAFPTVKPNAKKTTKEPNTFFSRPDMRAVDQSVNLKNLKSASAYMGESATTNRSSTAFSTTSSASRNSFVRNKKNPYLKVSAWEQFSYYVKDFCRSSSDVLCSKCCLGTMCFLVLAAVAAVVFLPILLGTDLIIKSSKLIVPEGDMSPTMIHPAIETIELGGVTYLAPVFKDEQVVAERTQAFQKLLTQHRMTPTHEPAQEALKWIAEFDPARLDVEADEGAILQRYALAVLFFATRPGTMANRTTEEALSSGRVARNDTEEVPDQDERRITSNEAYETNWMITDDICSWEGIGCDETNTRVALLNVSGAALHGELPPELALLKELTELDMGHNYLKGSLPEIYPERLTKLKYLMLADNLLSSTLPENFGLWASLTHIDLSENKIDGSLPIDLDQLTGLTGLFLHNNQFSGSIPELKGLKNLEYLYLNNCAFSGQLKNDFFKDRSLVEVRMEYNNLDGTLPHIHKLHQLEVLSLGNNDFNGTIPDQFSHTESLVMLDLHKNRFSGTLPDSLELLSNLEFLLLDHNYLSGELCPDSISGMKNLQTMIIHHNEFGGDIPSTIGELSKLHDIWLNDNSFVGSIPEELGQATSLRNVYLHKNSLTGTVPSSLNELESLGSLRLYSNNITGKVSDELCDLKEQHSLTFLAVDCVSKVECTCCDKCY